MQVKDAEIFSLIETIGQHYRNNIANRFLRRSITSISLPAGTWNQIELLTEKADSYRYQGFHLEELYSQVLAISKLIYNIRTDVIPNIRSMAAPASTNADKVYRDMTLNNFAANLKILTDYVNELYVRTVKIDKDNAGPYGPEFERTPELKDLGRLLVE